MLRVESMNLKYGKNDLFFKKSKILFYSLENNLLLLQLGKQGFQSFI